MLLEKFKELAAINTRLLEKNGKVYFKLQNKSKSLGLVPTDVIYAKTAALKECGFIEGDNLENFYFFAANGEYLFILFENSDVKRPWLMMHFSDADSSSNELYGAMLEIEFLSDKVGDFKMAVVPKGHHMEIYEDLSFEVFTNEQWAEIQQENNQSSDPVEEVASNIIIGDFDKTAA
tara:strand:- start:1405 stop:1935 length:531 start_codon:yes stop_codon:yes gene_type:complete